MLVLGDFNLPIPKFSMPIGHLTLVWRRTDVDVTSLRQDGIAEVGRTQVDLMRCFGHCNGQHRQSNGREREGGGGGRDG